MRKFFKRTLGLLIAIAMLLSGCGESRPEEETKPTSGTEIVIPALFRMDGETGNQPHKELIELFNQTYAGQYRIDVEWYVGDEASYRERIRLLNATDQLPAVFTDVGVLPDFYRLLVDNDRLVDIVPYLQADQEWAGTVCHFGYRRI